ncbi:hypothetical protein MA16_Dca019047 [Dendrobium catenatum]|uniref:Uncharacterized protein n=1 Tax=Dendrobium catenatum TaxID=906689 RepID=A0A2I0VHV1_9ASPA|nr:hypothetical protein MA16_Dca019047 [Dendrobium catenatum]
MDERGGSFSILRSKGREFHSFPNSLGNRELGLAILGENVEEMESIPLWRSRETRTGSSNLLSEMESKEGRLPVPVDIAKSDSNGVNNVSATTNGGSASLKQRKQNSPLTSNGSYGRGVLLGGHPSLGYQGPRFNFDGMRSPIP